MSRILTVPDAVFNGGKHFFLFVVRRRGVDFRLRPVLLTQLTHVTGAMTDSQPCRAVDTAVTSWTQRPDINPPSGVQDLFGHTGMPLRRDPATVRGLPTARVSVRS